MKKRQVRRTHKWRKWTQKAFLEFTRREQDKTPHGNDKAKAKIREKDRQDRDKTRERPRARQRQRYDKDKKKTRLRLDKAWQD